MKSVTTMIAAAALAATLVSSGAARADGAADAATTKLFKAQCASCHGVDGKGKTTAGKKVGVRDWTDPAAMKDFKITDIEKTIIDGVVGTDGKRRMASFAKLGPDKIAALKAYAQQLIRK